MIQNLLQNLSNQIRNNLERIQILKPIPAQLIFPPQQPTFFISPPLVHLGHHPTQPKYAFSIWKWLQLNPPSLSYFKFKIKSFKLK
jgi:hypothetical protein